MKKLGLLRTVCVVLLFCEATVAAFVMLDPLPAWPQNAVPPTAREAAASPEFASRLHPSALPGLKKPRAATRFRTGRPLPQGKVIYENGPVNGTTDAWTINSGYIVSDTFVADNGGSMVGGFDLYVWEFPGDIMTSLQWSITSGPNSGTVYGSGTVSGSSLTDTFISTNQFGYDIDKISATGLNLEVTAGSTYWFNVFNAAVPSGNPVFWDENSGAGCQSQGCPSQAVESAVGTIPSEAFDITGNPCSQAGGYPAIIPDFRGKEDGRDPSGAVTDAAGNVYRLAAGWDAVLSTLHNFYNLDGAEPYDGLIQATDGNFYGTTSVGGPCYPYQSGTVFKVTPSGALTTLHSFDGKDGAYPIGGLIQATDGNFYGTTNSGEGFPGTVFKITASGALTTLHSFDGNDGAYPVAGLIQATDGNFYGTTLEDGPNGGGTVFKITPSGTLTTLYSFGGSDGSGPWAGLIQATDGNFYGTTTGGGTNNSGTVFKITPSGTLRTLYSFCPQTNCADGANPSGVLIQATDGNFYGTTTYGGATTDCYGYGGCGTIFRITPSGTLTTLHSFDGADGTFPKAGLLQATDGNFYGTTPAGGASFNGSGTVFKITPSGTLTIVHSFHGSDGASPVGGLIQASDGRFYGTTEVGGASGDGTIFRLVPPRPCIVCPAVE